MDFSAENHPWHEPRLYKPDDNDLSKQWAVNYWIWSYEKNKLVRKRVVLTQPSIQGRLNHAKAVIAELNRNAGKIYEGEKPRALRVDQAVKPDSIELAMISPTLEIHRAVAVYLDFSKKVLSANTFRNYRTACMKLLKYLERHRRPNLPLGKFDVSDAIQFLKELTTVEQLSNRTRNNLKGYVGTFFNYAISQDRSKKLKKQGNPFEDPDITKLPQVQNKHQAYSAAQQQEYREVCSAIGEEYLLTYCRWMYYTLMRPHEELRRLRVRDVRTKLIYVTGETAKTNEAGYVDIPLPLEQLIQAQRIREFPGHYFVFSSRGEPGPEMVGNKYFYRRHVKVIQKMNLTGSGHDMYSWKHTGAIALWTATKDIELVRSQARHSDIKQTIEYLRDLGIRLADDDKIHKFPVF